MNRLLKRCRTEDNLVPAHSELLPKCLEVRKYLTAVADGLKDTDQRLRVDDLYEQCERADPAVLFPGCGALFDIYFVMFGPENMHRVMIATRRQDDEYAWEEARRRIQQR